MMNRMPELKCYLWVGIALALAWGLVSCATDSTGQAGLANAAAGKSSAAFTLSIDEASIYESAEFSVVQTEMDGITSVVVAAASVKNLQAVYLELGYDASIYQFLGSSTGDTFHEQDDVVLEMTIEASPGVVCHGQVLANWPERVGLNGDAVVVTFKFGPATFADKAAEMRVTAAVPASDAAKAWLNYEPKESVFFWYYVNPGDYDQNGEVSISDLTPLGANFNAEGPFSISSTLSVVDGDANGVINIADITPIGANFGNTIDSMRLFGSGSASDYPGGNAADNGPGTRQLSAWQFSEAKGGGSIRKHWEDVVDRPLIGDGNYWIRPVSNAVLGTPSQLVSHTQEWHTTELYDYEPGIESVGFAAFDQCTVNGKPAIVFFGSMSAGAVTEVTYISAQDAVGSLWHSPQGVIALNGLNRGVSLAEINGKPNFSWFDDDLGGLRYMQANDSQGSTWLSPVTIDTVLDAGYNSVLLQYAGKPVLVYSNGGQALMISLAANPTGQAWLTPLPLYSPSSISKFDAATLPGGIGVVLDDDDNHDVKYKFVGIQDLVVTLGSDKTVFSAAGGSSGRIWLGVAGGNPYILAVRSLSNTFEYSFALDAVGDTWVVPAVTGLPGMIQYSATATAYGLPWISYYDPGAGVLRSGRALKPQENSWVNEDEILDGFPEIILLKMSTAGIHPAVTYRSSTDTKIYFAAYY